MIKHDNLSKYIHVNVKEINPHDTATSYSSFKVNINDNFSKIVNLLIASGSSVGNLMYDNAIVEKPEEMIF